MKADRKKLIHISSLLLIAIFVVVTPLILVASNDTQNSEATTDEEWDEDKYGPKERIHLEGKNKSTFFNHSTHTVDIGLECESCHDELFEMESGVAEENGDFTMQSLKEGKYCGKCHDGETAFHAYTNCGGCHEAPKETIVFTEPVKAVIFDHLTHTDQGIDCEDCHKQFFKMNITDMQLNNDFTMDSIYCDAREVKYCGVCHDGETAFPSTSRCNVCHIGVKGYNKLKAAQKKERHGSGH